MHSLSENDFNTLAAHIGVRAIDNKKIGTYKIKVRQNRHTLIFIYTLQLLNIN